jgi:peptidyl-tRNA hydrolase
VLVISDDLDQPPAAVRLRQKGGHGGHNGLRSIIQHLGGSHDFPRIKIGEGCKEVGMSLQLLLQQQLLLLLLLLLHCMALDGAGSYRHE